MFETDTIAAVSTAMNNSGIGIIRISGDEAINIIKKIFVPAREKDLKEAPSHSVHYGNIVGEKGIVDEVLVVLMKGPHSYTREDVAEIDCHGGNYVMQQVLELVLKNGARIAEPGEFTKRAFLNGRIDLSQAEAVADLITAENDKALKSAVTQLKGSVSAKIAGLRGRLLEQTAYIEAALDDPEHIEMEGYGPTLLSVLEKLAAEVQKLIDTADDGRIIKEGIRTVIVGKPNVGKSSFLNAVLGEERAIVTDIAGTTRDTLEESVKIGDITLNIVDTAGIRSTEDVIEQIGVDRARGHAMEADLIVFIADASKPLDENDEEIISFIKGKKTIALLNKQDLETVIEKKDLSALLDAPVIETAFAKDKGLDEFYEKIREMFYAEEINFNDQVFITSARQKNALIEAEAAMKKAMESIEAGMPEDFYTIDMMAAYEALGRVIGESVEDDLADEIFSKFCMGK